MRLAADLGEFLVSPGFGGLAVLVGAISAVRTARGQLTAAREAAAVARVQGRKADAYLAVLRNAEQVGLWVQTVQHRIGAPTFPLPGEDGHLSARASLAAFGTPEVRGLWDAWHARCTDVEGAVRMIGIYDSDPVTFQDSALDALRRRMALDDEGTSGLRVRELVQREALGARMNVELAERPPAAAAPWSSLRARRPRRRLARPVVGAVRVHPEQ